MFHGPDDPGGGIGVRGFYQSLDGMLVDFHVVRAEQYVVVAFSACLPQGKVAADRVAHVLWKHLDVEVWKRARRRGRRAVRRSLIHVARAELWLKTEINTLGVCFVCSGAAASWTPCLRDGFCFAACASSISLLIASIRL
jgi:hypothetical protein